MSYVGIGVRSKVMKCRRCGEDASVYHGSPVSAFLCKACNLLYVGIEWLHEHRLNPLGYE